jgi:hypothetical protein
MPRRAVTLREGWLENLRADSNVVRDLLKIEDESERKEPQKLSAPHVQAPKTPGKTTFNGFIKGLGETEREVLKHIAENPPSLTAELETLARRNHAMPELIIDKINAAFLEQFGDLLIDTVDEQPAIQPEYKNELKKWWEEHANL